MPTRTPAGTFGTIISGGTRKSRQPAGRLTGAAEWLSPRCQRRVVRSAMATPRDLPTTLQETRSDGPKSPGSATRTPAKHAPSRSNTTHLTVMYLNPNDNPPRLSRGQVAERIGASVGTVRRYEGKELTPHVDENGVHWFDPKQVTAVAAARANDAIARGRIRNASPRTAPEERTKGEIAALVFERFEQRQSQAEIVIGLRVEPEAVQQLFELWCLGLIENQLNKREPRVPLVEDIPHVHCDELARRLAALPEGEVTRISIGRWRGVYQAGDDKADYAWILELGGFHASGPCTLAEVTRRFGPGSYRVTAYGFEPQGIRWEVLVEDLVVT